MNKIKSFVLNLGKCISLLTMLAPLYIARNYEKIDDYVFWLIWFVLYDIFMFSLIDKGKLE